MTIEQLQSENAQLREANSRLATIANDQADKTLLKAAIHGAWLDGYQSNIGPSSPSWIQKMWEESKTFRTVKVNDRRSA